jgi:hypothetical protein
MPRAATVRLLAVVGLVLYVIVRLALVRLQNFPYPIDLGAAWTGAATTAAETVPALLAVWAVLGIVLVGLAGWLRRRAPDLLTSEAAVGAVVVLWAITDLALLVLGPSGFYRPNVLRLLLVLVVVATFRWRSGPRRRPWPLGAWVAVLAFVLTLPPLVLMQVGSPVSPFMDILALIAAVQKVVTFQFYDPFANDASGIIALGRGSVGYDAPFSFLALVTGLPAHLAMTALIVPVALLQITAIYLLGRRAHGSMAGGLAAIFLLQTFAWRRTMDIRGTTLTFALVAFGIAILAGRRSGTRTWLGGLTLGTAVTVNPLIGAVGMLVASVQAVVAWIDRGVPIVVSVAALAGATVFALPQVFMGLSRPVPVWSLPTVGVLGLVVLAGAAALAESTWWRRPRNVPWARLVTILGIAAVCLLVHARRRFEYMDDAWFGYTFSALLSTLGVAAAAYVVWRRPDRRTAAAVPILGIGVAMLVHAIGSPYRFTGTLDMRSLASEVTTKMAYYWSPYWWALLCGVGFAFFGRGRAKVATVLLACALVIYPLRHVQEPLDYDAAQLSLAETWGFHLANAARGYHSGLPDRRWVVDERWRAIGDRLLAEVAAGRIKYDTHVVFMTPGVNSVETALWTGVSMDPFTPQWSADNIWLVGTRVRPMDDLAAALAARPPYVVMQMFPGATTPDAGVYDLIVDRPGVRLYRLKGLVGDSPAPPQG